MGFPESFGFQKINIDSGKSPFNFQQNYDWASLNHKYKKSIMSFADSVFFPKHHTESGKLSMDFQNHFALKNITLFQENQS